LSYPDDSNDTEYKYYELFIHSGRVLEVKISPHHKDIMWRNLTSRFKYKVFKRNLFAFLLLVLFLFISTPAVVMK